MVAPRLFPPKAAAPAFPGLFPAPGPTVQRSRPAADESHTCRTEDTGPMDFIDWALLAGLWVVCFGSGIAALSSGWVFPWLRKKILSPRLAGWGNICAGIGFTIGPGLHADNWGAVAVACCFMAGGAFLYHLSRRPKRA